MLLRPVVASVSQGSWSSAGRAAPPDSSLGDPHSSGHTVFSAYVCLSSLQTQAEELSWEHRSLLNAQETMKHQLLTGQLRESPEKPRAIATCHLMEKFGVEAALV